MPDSIPLSSLLVVCAVSTYVLGFLFRDQIVLRALVTCGSAIYATYYWIAGPEPLWDAMAGSVLIGFASLQGVFRLAWSRLPMAVPRGTEHILERIGKIEPGLFRTLMQAGDRIRVESPLTLTEEGMSPDALWFVVSGSFALERHGHSAMDIDQSGFIGEVAWLRGGNASATVVALPGAELVRWSHRDLRRLVRRNHRLDTALQALIAQNLAAKLTTSYPSAEIKGVIGG